MNVLRLALVVPSACVALLIGASSAGAGSGATCSGGVISTGTYQSLTVTGFCSLPDSGSVVVRGGLTIAPNAGLNAITEATLTVSGGISVGNGGFLGLGCAPSTGCATTTFDHIGGGVRADQPLAMLIHGNIIDGGVSMQGGGGGVTCDSAALFGGPPFTAIEDNTINGGVSVSGYQSCWLGVFRNTVRGSVSIMNNTLADPDATEVADNVISGDLACFGNTPGAQVGDSGGGPNTVSGQKLGECAGL